MGKKKLDISSFMDSSKAGAEESTPKDSSPKGDGNEIKTTSYRFKKSFLKKLQIYAIEEERTAASIIEQAVNEYIDRNR